MDDSTARAHCPFDLVVVGSSWGGLRALSVILEGLPKGFPVPLAIAQHRGTESSEVLVRLLQQHSPLTVVEASDKDPLASGHVYVAPPDYHLLVEPASFALSTEGEVRHSRPSIDVLFESASDTYAERLVGVILTGANEDGAAGLRRVRNSGGVAVVQDPATADRPEMPEAAIAAVPDAKVLSLETIAGFLVDACGR
jgi:two-component system chemotaxis response regulator CheB